MKNLDRICIALLVPRGLDSPASAGADAQVLVAWNARVLVVAEAEDRLLTLKGVRTAAMMHLAIHDAINSIDRRYRAYSFEGDASGADPLAAATQAAYAVAVDQYPASRKAWDAERRRWLARTRSGPARERGIAVGGAAAAAVLAQRANDGWNSEATYQWHPMGPGVYAEFNEHSGTPQGFVFGAGWAVAKPFALRSPSQFRSPPPPGIRSAEYTRAFEEVKEVGRFESTSRTADQSHLAMWWKDFAESSHNRLARSLVSDEQTDLWMAARLFALLNVSIMDAYISVFDNKFFYNHWRPYTAIHWAEHDGNRCDARRRGLEQPASPHLRVSFLSFRAWHGLRGGDDRVCEYLRRRPLLQDVDAPGGRRGSTLGKDLHEAADAFVRQLLGRGARMRPLPRLPRHPLSLRLDRRQPTRAAHRRLHHREHVAAGEVDGAGERADVVAAGLG